MVHTHNSNSITVRSLQVRFDWVATDFFHPLSPPPSTINDHLTPNSCQQLGTMSSTFVLEILLGLAVLSLVAALNIMFTSASWILGIIRKALPFNAPKLVPYFEALASVSISLILTVHSAFQPVVRTPRKARPLPFDGNPYSSTSSRSYAPDPSFSSPDSSFMGYTAIRTINMQYEGRPLSSTPFRARRRSSLLNPFRSSDSRSSNASSSPAYSARCTAPSADSSQTMSLPHLARAEPKLLDESDVSSLSLDSGPSSGDGSQEVGESVQSSPHSNPR